MSADEGGATSMAATNGERSTATPDPSTFATPGKRKRVSSQDDKAAHEASAASLVDERTRLQETLRNLVGILSKNDTELQLLSCPLPSSPVKPRSKRAKIAGEKDEAVNIQARVASDRYNTLSEFLGDFEKASAAVIERNKAQANGTPNEGTPVTETVNRIAAFKKLLNSLVRQAQVSPASVKAETPGNETEALEKPPASTEEIRNSGLVLTMFGNPANPKQLYSSLQKSVKVPLSSDESETKKYVEVQTPLAEGGLPNGITATKVPPYEDEKKPKVPKRTFGEVFAPKAALPQFEPPRRARSSSRASQITWIDSFDAVTNYRGFLGDRNNYAFAHLPSGNWLQYGGVTSSPSFWGRRQKQQSPQQHAEEKYHEDPILWADEDASIVQGVYSSFAPSFDSSGAVVQADSKNLVWWSKRGAKRLDVLLSIPDAAEASDTRVQPGSIGDLDESTLEEMVKSFNPDDFKDASIPSNPADDDQNEPKEKTAEEKDTDDLLAEISELLETLSSYQKIRNLDLPTSNQSAEAKDTPSTQTAPDQPSDAERDVYETLKSSLSFLISQLPPFAVAKLDGDQLAELNISQKILIENTDYPGSMEKDDYTLQQERAAATAANPVPPNRTSTPARPATNYQAPYNQRSFSGTPRVQPQGNFQGQQPYYPPRQPSTPGNFPAGNPQFAGARPPATPGQRPGYFPGYGQATPQFNQGNPVPQYQRPGQNGYNPFPAQPGPNPPQGSPQQYTPRPGQQAPYNVTPYGPGRSASPQKPGSYVPPRAPFMPPASNPQQRFVQQPQQPHQQPQPYGNYTPNQTPSTYSNSAAAATYARSAAEQAALMDRNRVQLAAQGGSASPATPQPQQQPPSDHQGSQDRSVTPGNKQNGTPVPA